MRRTILALAAMSVALLMATSVALAVVKSGTQGPDALDGTRNADEISGLGGGDDIRGLASNDELYGDADDDTVRGGRGADDIYGGGGIDRLLGGDGDDLIVSADRNRDTIGCGDGLNDTVYPDERDQPGSGCENIYPMNPVVANTVVLNDKAALKVP